MRSWEVRVVPLGKNDVSIVQTDSTTILRKLAEKEFEKRFSRICPIVPEAIKIRKSVMENSPFLKRLVEKINAEKPGTIEIIEKENDLVASGTNGQLDENRDFESESKTADGIVVQTKRTKGSN